MRPLILATALLAFAGAARADCPPGQAPASCALHEEAVVLFTAGKYEDAATKFRAAIAAGASARSYLGYSQSVEEQGKIALAYEMMLVAQKLSSTEMTASGGGDAEIVARSERIKYKLAELAAKISYVWLRVPEGVAAQRVVSVYREGEGDLPTPLGRWVVVAPERQVLFATLDDGTRVQVLATIAAGSKGTVVIPIPARPQIQQPAPVIQPQPPPPGYPQPQPIDRAPAGPKAPYTSVLGLDGAFIFTPASDVGSGLGFGATFEHKVKRTLALVGRGAIVFHPSQSSSSTGVDELSASATEGIVMVGARTRSRWPFYAALEVGVLIYSMRTTSVIGVGATTDEFSHTYPGSLASVGLRLGKAHVELGLLWAVNAGTDVDLPLRYFLTLGVDLVRR